MSSYYAAERLTAEIIEHVLGFLAGVSKATFHQLYGAVATNLGRDLSRQLQTKGSEQEVKRLVYYLDRRGYIERSGGRAEGAKFAITAKGHRRLRDLTFRPLALKTGQDWDGKWRVVIFDIPETDKLAREALRNLLKQLGFRQLQQSVWIHPLPCKAEINKIQQKYGIKEHITLMEVTEFDQLDTFKRIFRREVT